jgi:hypothetical protein
VLPHPPCIPDHLPSDYQLLGSLENANENIIMPTIGQCRMLCANGCRRGRAILTGGNLRSCSKVKKNVDKDGDYLEK